MKNINKLKNILKYGKIIFPVLALALAAGAAVLALNIRSNYLQKKAAEEEAAAAAAADLLAATPADELSIPLEVSIDQTLKDLFNSYYDCLSTGDMTLLATMCDSLTDSESLKLEEQSKYLTYSISEIYQQAGLEEGTYIVYVYCYVTFVDYPDLNFPAYNGYYVKTAEDGSLYVVKGSLSEEENNYISAVASQDDVVELNNRVTVEYNDMVLETPEILNYLVELDTIVSTAVGERLAALNADIVAETPVEVEEPSDAGDTSTATEPEEEQVKYVTANTRVNVRASDSVNSSRIGEVYAGDTLEVIEVLENGWTKVVFEGGEGYISSEFLSPVIVATNVPTIGMLTAIDEVNVRSMPDASGERLGALTKGDQLELTAVEDGWCAVKYNGVIAYVICDYVEYVLFE